MSNNTNDSIIKKQIIDSYKKIMNRPADLAGLDYYFNEIKKGNLTLKQVESTLKYYKFNIIKKMFFGIITSPIRVLPNFIIIGAHKAGTTSLFNNLIRHPSVISSTFKEVNFFNIKTHYEKGILFYKSYFPTFLSMYNNKKKYKREFVTGEASTHYLANSNVPKRVFNMMPKIKLIAILRNPVDRAYSDYNMKKALNLESLSFEDAIDKEIAHSNLKENRKKLTGHKNQKISKYLQRGIYVDQLKDWMSFFPKEQFLILQTEEFDSKPNETLNKVCTFLGLPEWTPEEKKKYNIGKYSKMSPETRKLLMNYFNPHNKRLNEFLNTNFDWDR